MPQPPRELDLFGNPIQTSSAPAELDLSGNPIQSGEAWPKTLASVAAKAIQQSTKPKEPSAFSRISGAFKALVPSAVRERLTPNIFNTGLFESGEVSDEMSRVIPHALYKAAEASPKVEIGGVSIPTGLSTPATDEAFATTVGKDTLLAEQNQPVLPSFSSVVPDVVPKTRYTTSGERLLQNFQNKPITDEAPIPASLRFAGQVPANFAATLADMATRPSMYAMFNRRMPRALRHTMGATMIGGSVPEVLEAMKAPAVTAEQAGSQTEADFQTLKERYLPLTDTAAIAMAMGSAELKPIVNRVKQIRRARAWDKTLDDIGAKLTDEATTKTFEEMFAKNKQISDIAQEHANKPIDQIEIQRALGNTNPDPAVWGPQQVLGPREQPKLPFAPRTRVRPKPPKAESTTLPSAPPEQLDLFGNELKPTESSKIGVVPGANNLGFTKPDLLFPLGGALGGAVTGAAVGDTPEEKITNAIGGGLTGLLAGSAMTGAKRRPVRLARSNVESLPQRLQDRIKPNAPTASPASYLQQFMKDVWHGTLGETLDPEHALRIESPRATAIHPKGFEPAIEHLKEFKSKRLDVTSKTFQQIKNILGDLNSAAEFKDFEALIAFRHDLASRNAGKGAEGNLTSPELRAAIDHLMAKTTPQVREAIIRHSDTMDRMYLDQSLRGKLSKDARKQWILDQTSAYMPDVVLKYEKPLPQSALNVAIPMGKTSPIKASRQGYLKKRVGGDRTTLHDYLSVMSRYLNEVNASGLKSDLISKIAADYDPTRSPEVAARLGLEPEQVTHPKGVTSRINDYTLFSFDGEVYALPKPLATRLGKYVVEPGHTVKMLNKLTGKSKAVILRSVWGSYTLNNLFGDTKQYFDNAEVNPLMAGKLYLDAARAAKMLRDNVDPTNLTGRDRALLSLAHRGQAVGLGTGAATGELGTKVFEDPQLRALSYDPNAPWHSRAKRKLGDLKVSAFHKMDIDRAYMENIPRLAKFMEQISLNKTDKVAGQVSRHVLFDYTDLSPAMQHMMRGLFFPFITYYYKNFVARVPVPGLSYDPSGSYKGAVKRSAKLAGKALTLGVALTAYNETFFPDQEHNLSDWQKAVPHFFVPWINGALWVGVPGPANMAGRMLGVAGLSGRAIDLARGRTTPGEELDKSKSQLRFAHLGLVNPFLAAGWALTQGEDIRSGRNISPEAAGAGQRAKDKAFYLATQAFPPTGAVYRSIRESDSDPSMVGGAAKTGFELAKTFAIGDFIRKVDQPANIATQRYQAAGRATNRQREDALKLKNMNARQLSSELSKLGPEQALGIVEYFKTIPGIEGEQAMSTLVAALKLNVAWKKDYALALREAQLASQDFGAKKSPYMAEELIRKGLVPKGLSPASDRQNLPATSPEAWRNWLDSLTISKPPDKLQK